MKLEMNKGALAIGVRQILYLAVCICAMVLQHTVAYHCHEDTCAENGIVENMQLMLLIGASVVFFVHALIHRREKTVLYILSGLCALGACREMDRVLDELIPVVSWKVGVLFVIVPVVFAFRHIKEVVPSLERFLQSRCFVMLCCAFTIILVLGQLIGHKPYLKAVIVDMEHLGTIKEMVEESIETIGYLLILLASIESFFDLATIDREVVDSVS